METAHSPWHDRLNTHRVKRRRTRRERNKLHSAPPSSSQAKQGNKEKGEPKRHMRYKTRVMPNCVSDEVIKNAITTNRLTRRLGIFNQMKKSKKILRKPLHVSQEVQVKTDKDIERILDLSDAGLHHPVKCSTLRKWSVGRYPTDGQKEYVSSEENSRQVQANGGSASCRGSADSAFSLPRSAGDCYSACVAPPHVEPTPDSLPQSPELEAIANRLLQAIKPRNAFPDRSYLNETVDELRKLLRQNDKCQPGFPRAPSSRGSRSSETRPCSDQEWPVLDEDTKCPLREGGLVSQKAAVPETSVALPPGSPAAAGTVPHHSATKGDGHTSAADAASQEKEDKSHQVGSTASRTAIEHQHNMGDLLNIPLDALTDAKSLLECNDRALEKRIKADESNIVESQLMESVNYPSQTVQSNRNTRPQHCVAVQYHQKTIKHSPRNETISDYAGCTCKLPCQRYSLQQRSQYCPRLHATGVRYAHSHLAPPVPPTAGLHHDHNYLSTTTSRGPDLFNPSCYNQQPVTMTTCPARTRETTSGVVTEFTYPSAAAQTLTCLQHFDDCGLMTSAMPHGPAEEAMDILDLLDQSDRTLERVVPSTITSSLQSSPRSLYFLPTQYHPYKMDHKTSSDTSQSSGWYPVDFPPLRKPPRDTPSPQRRCTLDDSTSPSLSAGYNRQDESVPDTSSVYTNSGTDVLLLVTGHACLLRAT